MAANQLYLAIGEEATRATAESTTVGFIPIYDPAFPDPDFADDPVNDFRGAESALGQATFRRNKSGWTGSFTFDMFTEAGTTAGIVGTLLKHFFGGDDSNQNASTGQYMHLLYPVSDPFATGNLGTKALTFNLNATKDASTVENWVYSGGRVTSLSFNQTIGQALRVTCNVIGQQIAVDTAIASPTYAAENLICDFDNLSTYYGTITRTEDAAPVFTDYAFGSASQMYPESITVTMENGMTDKQRLSGVKYADKTIMGMFNCSVELTTDYEDPTSGFSSRDDYYSWLSGLSSLSGSLFLNWDTGTAAGTGDNHQFGIDIPIAQRAGGLPTFSRESDPMRTISYTTRYDASTTKYRMACYLKNTATAV